MRKVTKSGRSVQRFAHDSGAVSRLPDDRSQSIDHCGHPAHNACPVTRAVGNIGAKEKLMWKKDSSVSVERAMAAYRESVDEFSKHDSRGTVSGSRIKRRLSSLP